MLNLYLAFKPVSSPFPQTLFRAENVEFIYAACFPHDRFSGYDFSAHLTSHILPLFEKMVLSCIKLFLKARGGINHG
jgi:hypothetical protein